MKLQVGCFGCVRKNFHVITDSAIFPNLSLICVLISILFMLLMVIRLERKTVKRKRVFATLKVLGTVLEQLTKEVSPEEAGRLIPEEV